MARGDRRAGSCGRPAARRSAGGSRGPLELDLGVFRMSWRRAALFVAAGLLFHVVMPVVWPLLPVRPALFDRVAEFREWSITRSGWMDECLAFPPLYGCVAAANGARATATAEMNLVRRAAGLGLAPVWAYWEAAGRARPALEVACPPDMPRRERAECRRFEMF